MRRDRRRMQNYGILAVEALKTTMVSYVKNTILV